MKRKIQLTESELIDMIKRIINEQEEEEKKGLFGKLKDKIKGTSNGGANDIKSLEAEVGKVKDLGQNRYQVRSLGTSQLGLEFAQSSAKQNATGYIIKHLNMTGNYRVTLTNGAVSEERAFKEGNNYKYFLTYTVTVNK